MTDKIANTDEAWDLRELGADEHHVAVCSAEEEAQIDEMMELQAISIRLPKSLINDFKMIAEYNGIGYQPLMRDILCRFAHSETRKIALELMEARAQERKEQSHTQSIEEPEIVQKAA